MTVITSVTDAKARLSELVRASDGADVVLTRNGKPAAVMMSVNRHAALVEAIEDLGDPIYARNYKPEPGMPWEEFKRELAEAEPR